MPPRSGYTDGMPCWADLTTNELAAARGFYSSLFGWEWDGIGPPDDPAYWMATLGGERVAGLSTPVPETEHLAPSWDTWISVGDVEDAGARVEANGGTIVLGPFEVPGHGRGCMVADPAGAAFGLWEAGGHIGSSVVDEHGTAVWHELLTPNIRGAGAYYGAVFGWVTGAIEFPHCAEYTTLFLGIETVGGVAPPPGPDLPPQWRVWFGSDDVAATVDAAVDLGASVTLPVTASPIGDFARLVDPTGAPFNVIAAG